LRGVWNGIIGLAGAIVGHVLALGVRREWLHFPFVSEALSIIPFSFGWKFRRAVYARILPSIGRDAVLHWGVVLDDARTSIGEDVWVSQGCYLDYSLLGPHVLVGPHAVILSGGRHHRMDRLDVPIKQQGNPIKMPVRIGEGAWIGANATVMADIGEHAVVGAGSVVTHAVPPFAIVAGNPARILRFRTEPRTDPPNASGQGI